MERIPVIPTAREELAEAVSSGPVSPPSPIACSSWLAKSLMQKSIRRGREDLALRAAATLLKDRLSGSIRCMSDCPRRRSPRRPRRPKNLSRRASRSSFCRSPISEATLSRSISSMA